MTPEPAPADSSGDQPLGTVDALVQLSFLTKRLLAATGAEHDLSVIQIRLLGILRDRQAGMVELGTHLGLDKSSMTGLVARAEKRGLVRRLPSPHDGRGVLVALTPEGHRLTDLGTAEITRRLDALTGTLTTDERAAFRALATKLLTAPRLPPGA
jgi:DNA-binding MarR family transcriptional regulator